jgi:ribosomal-protein-alanine N-acetyltransferase
LDAVVRINLRCLPENYNPSFYLDLFMKFPATFIVAEAQGQVVGYVMCRIERGFSELTRFRLVKKGHVVSLAVVPEYRRQGMAAAVTASAMKGMIDLGADECFLEVRISNLQAIGLYEKLGLQRVREIPYYYKDGETAYVMAVDLATWDDACYRN